MLQIKNEEKPDCLIILLILVSIISWIEFYGLVSKILIKKNIRVKNEFYVSQIYNEYILDNKKIIHYPIVEIFSINTPAELENNKNNILDFLRNY